MSRFDRLCLRRIIKPEVIIMNITSSDFSDGGMIPAEFSRMGGNASPSLEFTQVPANAKSLALVCYDPDAAKPGGFVHWVVWNISPATSGFSKNGLPMMAVQGKNDWGENRWGGPQPPSGTHRYIFTLYALDTQLSLLSSEGKPELDKALNGHVIETASLRGLYSA